MKKKAGGDEILVCFFTLPYNKDFKNEVEDDSVGRVL